MFDETIEQKSDIPNVFIIDQECVDSGLRRDHHSCPIALSMMKGGLENVNVSKSDVYCVYGGEEFYTALDKETRMKIEFFDAGASMKPFVFKVNGWLKQ